jgi:hypothetical protein
MIETNKNNNSEFAASGISEADQDRAMRLGIAFNGTQFVYRDFKYDRLADAFSYAELDIQREGRQPVATTSADWLPRPIPNSVDQALMKQYGIIFEDWRYKFRGYRYDRLADAVNYARVVNHLE